MPGNVPLWWQSRQSGMVFVILLSIGSPLTWWISSGTSERPQSLHRFPYAPNTRARSFASCRPRGRSGRWAAQ